jgi:hypothetical protein
VARVRRGRGHQAALGSVSFREGEMPPAVVELEHERKDPGDERQR